MDKFHKNTYGRNNKTRPRLTLKNPSNTYMNCKPLFLQRAKT